MSITVRRYCIDDLPRMTAIWNGVIEDGVAFPQEEAYSLESAADFFGAQTYCGVAETQENGVCGLYILHPNNVGRCGHLCNASFAVDKQLRGLHIGEALVSDCLIQGKLHGFGILQLNAVVEENVRARRLYEKLGFIQLGVIPRGFRLKNGEYTSICPYYRTLD